ncbi:MAG: diguanylate cyclase [Magnetococcus sp. YQC-9]
MVTDIDQSAPSQEAEPNSKRGRSLLIPIVGLLILTVLATMGVGYFINYPFLNESLHTKARIEHEARAAQLGFLIDHEANNLSQLANAVSRDGELQEALTVFNQDFNRLMRKVLFLSETIRSMDFIGVLDTGGKTLFSTEGLEEHPLPGDAVTKGNKTGGHLLSIAIGQRWAMVAVAPITIQRKTVGLLLLGRWIHPDLVRRPREKRGEWAIAHPDGFLASTIDANNWPAPDPERIRVCPDSSSAQTHVVKTSDRGVLYAPLILVGRSFCLILPVDFSPIHQALRDHALRLGWSSLIIILMIGILGLAMHFLILQPLNRLRHKALILVEVCSTNEKLSTPSLSQAQKGNEIQILDQAFETASTAIYSYIGELHHQKEHFEDMAIRDPLTGLGNRRLFTQLVEKSLAVCQRYQRRMAVMYLDLDHFKPINDTLGHDIGDLLLKAVASRLKQALRDSDVVFRLGGDEFAALLPECAEGELARQLGERLIRDVAKPYLLNGHECRIGVSVGVSIFPDHAEQLDVLLKHADVALYAAKDAGRGVCRLYGDA